MENPQLIEVRHASRHSNRSHRGRTPYLFAVLDLWEAFPTDTIELWVLLAVSRLDRLKAELDAERQRLH